MSITTLKGTTWKIKQYNLTKPKQTIQASINFISNDYHYSLLDINVNEISGYMRIRYDDKQIWFEDSWITSSGSGTYENYSKIQIIDGKDINNQELINWLTQNAELLFESETYEHLYTKKSKIIVDAAIRDGLGRKIDTTYVTKNEIKTIVEITQEEYDAIETPDKNILYLITED